MMSRKIRDIEEENMHCPLGEKKRDCWQCEYGKGGLCDWPYRYDMTLQEARYITELLKTIEREAEVCQQR